MLTPKDQGERDTGVAPEEVLLEQARRISRNRKGRCAVQIHLSRLRPQNQKEHHMRIAARSFDKLENPYDMQVFLLSNNDIMLLTQSERITDVDAAVDKIRSLFAEDPLIWQESESGEDRLCTWFDLEADLEGFVTLVLGMITEAGRDAPAKAAPPPRPLDPILLEAVCKRLGQVSLPDFARKQSIVGIMGANKAQILFQELFISIGDLQKTIAADVNLLGDRWLFQHLTQELDKRMLGMLRQIDTSAIARSISLNLNLTTLVGPDFRAFDEKLTEAHRRSIIVEIQNIDVFSDMGTYGFIRDFLQERGYRVLIDGLTHLALRFYDPCVLKADYYKINWSAEMVDQPDQNREDIKELLKQVRRERMILSRCDSEASIKWGLTMGILSFQGRFIDKMMVAMGNRPGDERESTALKQNLEQGFAMARRTQAKSPEQAQAPAATAPGRPN